MKYTASRLSEGNKLFPPEIHCEENGLTVKIPGLFKGESQYFDYQQISSVGVDTPLVGFSTIKFYAGGNFISAHGFTTSEVKEVKRAIDAGKIVRLKPTETSINQSTKLPPKNQIGDIPFSATDSTDEQIINLLRQGKKLDSVKLCREISGMEIADAKAYVESLQSQIAVQRSHLNNSQSSAISSNKVNDTKSKENKISQKGASAAGDADIFDTLLSMGRDAASAIMHERYGYPIGKLITGFYYVGSIYFITNNCIIDSLDTEEDGFLSSKKETIGVLQQYYVLNQNQAEIIYRKLRDKYLNLKTKILTFSKNGNLEGSIVFYLEQTNEDRDSALWFINTILLQEHKDTISKLVKDGRSHEAIKYIQQNTHHKGSDSTQFMNEIVEKSKGCMSIIVLFALVVSGVLFLVI